MENDKKYFIERIFILLLSLFFMFFASSCSCKRCKIFNKYVHSFQYQMNKSDKQQQKQLIFTIFYDQGDYNCHYNKSITSCKKINSDLYIVDLTFYCCCNHTFCFHENKAKTLSITINVKSKENFYALYAE